MVKMVFGRFEPLPEEYKDVVRQMREQFTHDMRALRALRDSPTFTGNAFWPSKEWIDATLTCLDAFVACFDEELRCSYTWDKHWMAAQQWLKEAQRIEAEAFATLPVPCVREQVTRPRARWCTDDQWGSTRRGCARPGAREARHG